MYTILLLMMTDIKMSLLLFPEENLLTATRRLDHDNNLNCKTKEVFKTLKHEKNLSYKMQAVQEVLESNPDQ